MSDAVRTFPLCVEDCRRVARALELAARVMNESAKADHLATAQRERLLLVGQWDELQRGFGAAVSGSLLVAVSPDVAERLRALEGFPDAE